MPDKKLKRRDDRMSAIRARKKRESSENLMGNPTFLLASTVESSDDAIITKTSKGIITSWNRGAEIVYGFSAGEVLGKPVSILIPPGRMTKCPQSWIASGEGKAYTTTKLCDKGRTRSSFTFRSVSRLSGTKPIKFDEFAKVVAELGIYWLMVNVPPVQ